MSVITSELKNLICAANLFNVAGKSNQVWFCFQVAKTAGVLYVGVESLKQERHTFIVIYANDNNVPGGRA